MWFKKSPPSFPNIVVLLMGSSGFLGALIFYLNIIEKFGIIKTIFIMLILLSLGVIIYSILILIYWYKIRSRYLHFIQKQPKYSILESKILIEIKKDSDQLTATRRMIIQKYPDKDHKFVDHLYICEGKRLNDIDYESKDCEIISEEWTPTHNQVAVWWLPKTDLKTVPIEYNHSFTWSPCEYNINENGEMFMTYPSTQTGIFELDIKSAVPIEKAIAFLSKKRVMNQDVVLNKSLLSSGHFIPPNKINSKHFRWSIKELKEGFFYYFTWFYQGKESIFQNNIKKSFWKHINVVRKAKRL